LSKIPEYKDFLPVYSAIDPRHNMDDEDIVTEIKYYNVALDEYIILANGVEVLRSPLPYKHKELPFGLFYDYKVDDRIWGM
jgi:hypothetical protein